MKKAKPAISAILLALLSGCSSTDGDIRKYVRCGIAAEQLEQRAASDIIGKQFALYLLKNNIRLSDFQMMSFFEEVRNDDLSLYRMNTLQQAATLIDVYNSSACLEIHGQKEITFNR